MKPKFRSLKHSIFASQYTTISGIRAFAGKYAIIPTLVMGLAASQAQAANILWSSSGGSAWLTGGNWTGGAVAGAGDVAQFGANPSGTTVGINFNGTTNAGTQTLGNKIQELQAIELTSDRAGALSVGNSTSTAGANGTLRLLGGTVNSVANVILRNNSSQQLTIQNTSGTGNQLMSLSLGNSTDNKIVIDGSGNIIISNVIISNSGTTPLTIMGGGTGSVDITGTSNTFTGNININGATARFSADGSLGNANNDIIIDGGRFSVATGFTLGASRDVFVGDGAGTAIEVVSGTQIINTAIANKTGETGSWAKQGTGVLELGAASSYTGSTAINSGTLRLTTGNDRLPIGTVVSLGQASSANLGTLDLNGRNQTIAGLVSTSGTNATVNTNVVTSSTSAILTIDAATDNVYSAGTAANSGIISGEISLVKKGVGNQTLGGSNTYTGGTEIQAGTLTVAGGSALADTGAVSVGAVGTLRLNASERIGSLSGASGATVNLHSNALTVGDSSNTTFSGNINGTGGSLTKTGAGTLTLEGASSNYTGGTVINQGTVVANSNNALGSGGVVMSAGALMATNGTVVSNGITIGTAASTSNNPFTIVWNFGTTSGNADPSSSNAAGFTVSSVSQGNNNGTTTLLGTTSPSSNPGASGDFNAGANTINGAFNSGTSTYFAFTLNPTTATSVSLNDVSFGSRSTATGPTAYSIRDASDLSTSLASGTFGAVSTWAGYSPSFTDTVIDSSGTTFRLYGFDGTGAVGGAANWRIDDLTLTGTSTINVIASGTGTLGINTAGSTTYSGAITVNNTATLTAATDGTASFTNTISGPGSITKTGEGKVILSGVNTYTGATIVNAGVLEISNTGSINNTSAITINGGTFKYNASTALTIPTTFTSGTLGGTNWTGAGLNNLTVGSGQIISPGNSPGTATTVDQTWAGGGTYLFEINDVDGDAGADPGWDLLSGSGTLTITATLSNPFVINLTSLNLSNAAGNAVNFDNTLNYFWMLADFANPVGTFAADAFTVNTSGFSNLINGTFAVALGGTGDFGGDNTQLYLTYTAIPEPKAALLGAIGMLLLLRRRR